MKKQLLACVLVGFAAVSHAQDEKPSDWRFVGRLGVGFGGENIEQGYYVGGKYWELSTGSGMKYALGADYRLAPKVVVQATLGRDISTVPADQGDQYFSRNPVEILGLVDITNAIRMGVGVRQSTNAAVVANGAYVTDPMNGAYDASPGFVFEAQYIISASEKAGSRSQFGVSLRFVSETFKKSGMTFKGDHGELAFVLNY